MTTTKKKEIQLNKSVTLFKSNRGIKFEKQVEGNNLISEYNLKDLNGYEIALAKKDNSEGWWALAGFLLAIIVWQVSSVPIISIVGSIILIIISLFLVLDYLFSKRKIILCFSICGKEHNEFIDLENIEQTKDFLNSLKIT